MKDTTNYKIFGELAEIDTNYHGTSLEKVQGLTRSQYQVIRMCEFYSDSKYMGTYLGNKKSIGDSRVDVPFYNVVNYRVTVAKVGTDLDIKDFQVVSDNPKHQVESMLLNRELYEWMKGSGFSQTLNDMGTTRPKYGGYVVKKCKDPEWGIKLDVVKWANLMTDQNDILGAPIVETHHMTPVEIKRKDGAWENVVEVLKAHKKLDPKERPTVITVHEITGEFPIAVYKNAEKMEESEADQYEFSMQHYFIAEVGVEKFLMFCEELSGEMTDFYEYLSWEDNGYGLGRGVIEDAEEAQVWTNDAVVNEMIAMTLAGRVGIKTNSKKLGNNVLAHDHGKIYELGANEDMNSFNLAPAALGQYENQRLKWKEQGNDATASYDAATGETPPASTPLGTTQLLNAVASKPLDYKREEWGIHLTKLANNWMLPNVIKRLKKKHILVSDFTDQELNVIDQSFSAFHTNAEIVKEAIRTGDIVSPIQQADLMDAYTKHLKGTGNKRYLELPNDYFDGIEARVTVITTGEQKNKGTILQSNLALMNTYTQSLNPATGEYAVETNPTLSTLFNESVELAGSGVSPVSLSKAKSMAPAPAPAQAAPAPATAPMSPMAGMAK